jgi:hypothetical protein
MAVMHTLDSVPRDVAVPSAVTWIDEQNAIVAAMSRGGGVSTCEISRGWLSEASFLAQVVRVIGDRQRVVILGPSPVRLLLEREYVAAFHRPDRLIDVELAGPAGTDELVARLRTLAA